MIQFLTLCTARVTPHFNLSQTTCHNFCSKLRTGWSCHHLHFYKDICKKFCWTVRLLLNKVLQDFRIHHRAVPHPWKHRESGRLTHQDPYVINFLLVIDCLVSPAPFAHANVMPFLSCPGSKIYNQLQSSEFGTVTIIHLYISRNFC